MEIPAEHISHANTGIPKVLNPYQSQNTDPLITHCQNSI